MVTNWDRALKRFRKAEAALTAAAHTKDEALYDRLGDRHDRALQRLLLTPAPNVAALALKLDLAPYDAAVELVADVAAMQAIKQDARRLAGCPRPSLVAGVLSVGSGRGGRQAMLNQNSRPI